MSSRTGDNLLLLIAAQKVYLLYWHYPSHPIILALYYYAQSYAGVILSQTYYAQSQA